MADFVNSKWPPTFKSKMAANAKVSGHFEFLNLTITLSRKEILPCSFFKSYLLEKIFAIGMDIPYFHYW